MQAEVHVNSVKISTVDGQGRLSGLTIGNPGGFKADHALKAGTIEIVIDPASIAQDVIVLHKKVLIDAPNIVYESGSNGSNFDVIQHNVETYVGAGGEKGQGEKSGSNGKKMIIDSFIVRNARINYGGKIELPLPVIELHNIGRNSGGATSAQVTRAVIAELNARLVVALGKSAVINRMGSVAAGARAVLQHLMRK